MKTLFISDIHLDPERPDIQKCFDQFIESCLADAEKIESIYILGDLFEVWIGDDASIPLYRQPIEQLKKLSDYGIKLFVMHGNRDFLMGSEFEKACGCTLIPDLYLFNSSNNAQTILLSHGDIFCTDDKEYMSFRKMVRDSLWQTDFLNKSIGERIKMAQAMREQSKQRGQEKQSDIMDVNQESVESIMDEYQVSTLIHGHTHRPAKHEFQLNGQIVKRIVLPDWSPDAKIFELE